MWKHRTSAGNPKADLENSKALKVLAFSRARGVLRDSQSSAGGLFFVQTQSHRASNPKSNNILLPDSPAWNKVDERNSKHKH
ncbi:uncharacterized [Tachysurus ichikawai]